MHKFKATIDIIGLNPFVYIPEQILKEIFAQKKDSCRIYGIILNWENGK